MFDNETKSASILLKVAPTEKLVLQALANKEDLTISEYIRKHSVADRDIEDINEALSELNTEDMVRKITEEDLVIGKRSDNKSLTVTLSPEELEEIDLLAKEAGVPRTAFARNRVLYGKQTINEIELNFEGIDELIGMVDDYNQTLRNLLRKVERAECFSDKDIGRMWLFVEKQKEGLRKMVNTVVLTQAKLIRLAKEELKKAQKEARKRKE